MAGTLCTTSVLVGSDGLVMLKPAGTTHCLLDLTDFPAGDKITVPVTHDFKPGDPIVFTEEGGHLDSALAVGTKYWVGLVSDRTIQILTAKGGTPVALNGDGGVTGATTGPVKSLGTVTGGSGYTNGVHDVPLSGGTGVGAIGTVTVAGGTVTAAVLKRAGNGYTVGDVLSGLTGAMGGGSGWHVPVGTIVEEYDTPGGHINVSFADYDAVCNVKSWQFSMNRDKIETTALPCKVSTAANKYAKFKTYQAGFADGTGSMEVQFSEDQDTLAGRILANAMLQSQEGAWVKLYVHAVASATSGDMPDDAFSNYIEAPISLEGMSISADSSGTNPTTATINFSISGTPAHLFTLDLV